MKRLSILLLLFVTMTSFAQMKSQQRGDAGMPISAYPHDNDISERKIIGLSFGADVQNAIWGGKKLDDGTRRNEQAFDGVLRLFYGRSHVEVGAFVEYFHAIGYTATGLDANYVGTVWEDIRLMYIGGLEIQTVWRDRGILFPANGSSSYGSTSRVWGFNNRLRVENLFDSPFSVEWRVNWKHRADVRDLAENNLMDEPIPDFWDSFSNYVSVIVYF